MQLIAFSTRNLLVATVVADVPSLAQPAAVSVPEHAILLGEEASTRRRDVLARKSVLIPAPVRLSVRGVESKLPPTPHSSIHPILPF
jgi:hypothetical protein